MARKVFADSVIPIPVDEGLAPNGLMVNAVAAGDQKEKMEVRFSLGLPAEKSQSLEELVARGGVVKPKELMTKYATDKAEVDKLSQWLKEQGFEITQVAPDNSGIYARADVEQIEKSLQVNMARVTRDGITYTAAKDAPSLPEEVAGSVYDIGGLQPFRHMQKHFRRFPTALNGRTSIAGTGAQTGAGKSAGKAAQPTPAVQNAPPYLVSEILKAYDAAGLPVNGSGQTIAILIDTFPDLNDLKKFWSKNHLTIAATQIQKIDVSGGNLPAPEGEETLDASWASGIAPGAKIRIYATGSLQFVALNKALDRILADLQTQPGLRQLSISLGLGELYMGGPTGPAQAQHERFLKLAAAGVNIFVSSGDAGSNPDLGGHHPTGSTQAEYAASDTAVIGVGGTSLTLKPTGAVAAETGWAGGGGGRSVLFSRPVWQQGAGVPAGADRLVPDVSLVADPNTGAFLVVNGKAIQLGGTSWSAPVWAGFCAMINEARVKAGKPPLPFLNPLLYPLQGTACFRDIKAGSNGAYQAGPGFDLVTGLGVPSVKELIKALA